MKKIYCILLSVAIVLTSTFIALSATKGDVNSDGRTNSEDALLILKCSVGGNLPPYFERDKADLTGDGRINSADALMVLQIAVGTIKPSTEHIYGPVGPAPGEPIPGVPGKPNYTTTTTTTISGPLAYSKSQLIDYYNSCLRASYSKYTIFATKTENVDVSVSGIDIGSVGIDADKFANSIIANNTKNNGKLQEKHFRGGIAGDGTDITRFVLPANLYDDAVKSISASKNGDGYKLVIKLNQESCPINGVAKYNASCAWPLDINEIDFGSGVAVSVNEGTLNYIGTTITATIDSHGRVIDTVVDMPLRVTGIKAVVDFKVAKVDVGVGFIDGKWTCHNTMAFPENITYPDPPMTKTTTEAPKPTDPMKPGSDVYNALAIQRKFGFNKAYDNFAGLANFYLDTIRVYFTYEGKDWLIELWKGEYAMASVGCEIGFYYNDKPSSDKDGPLDVAIGEKKPFKAVEDKDAMYCSMELWQYVRETDETPVKRINFGRRKCWWAAGFENGVLEKHSDRTSLVMRGTIEFPTAAMRNLFLDGLDERGFRAGSTSSYNDYETYSVSGNKVTINWRYYDEDRFQESR